MEIKSGERKIPMGIFVDSVSEVLSIKGGDIEDAPSFEASLDTTCIFGMAKSGQGVKILLDIDRVMRSEEMAAIGLAA